jgi:hypothetical protein
VGRLGTPGNEGSDVDVAVGRGTGRLGTGPPPLGGGSLGGPLGEPGDVGPGVVGAGDVGPGVVGPGVVGAGLLVWVGTANAEGCPSAVGRDGATAPGVAEPGGRLLGRV